ncbi:hypothetical protein FKM82_025896 [Ascaphus truei]
MRCWVGLPLYTSQVSLAKKYPPHTSSSPFIPTLNAITSSQDLSWMVQPSVRPLTFPPYHAPRPGVIRSMGGVLSVGRRRHGEHVSNEKRGPIL